MKSSMKLSKTLLFAFLLLGLTLAPFTTDVFAQKPTEQSESPKNLLQGRWKSDEAVVEIRANGTIMINDDEYRYVVKNGIILVSDNEGSLAFPYSLKGDTLKVDFQGREIVYTRMKGKEAETTATAAAPQREGVIPEFVGKWCYMANLTGSNSYMSSRCFVLHPNGTYEYYAESSSSGAYGSTAGQSYDSGRWTATRTTLTAYSNKNGKIVYPIELRNHPKNKNDPMIVVDGDAYVTATQRRPW